MPYLCIFYISRSFPFPSLSSFTIFLSLFLFSGMYELPGGRERVIKRGTPFGVPSVYTENG